MAVVAMAIVQPVPAHAGTPVPRGFRAKTVQLAPGVIQQTLVRRGVPLVAHVARVQPGAPFELRSVLSHGQVNGSRRGLQRTSQMCAAARCIAAINGDFFGAIGQPVGGVVSAGEIIRSPSRTHHQFSVLSEGGFAAGQMTWQGTLATDDAQVPVKGVNVERNNEQTVLYTPRYGISTRTNRYGSELVLRFVNPTGPLQLGQQTVVELVAFRQNLGNARIPRDGAVLSAHGAAATALQALWANTPGMNGSLLIDSNADARETIGGTPILMRKGHRWFANTQSFYRTRAPRTIVGWNPRGELFLVAIDGRQPGYSVGASLLEATQLMSRLGATEAINLDGGGSTTFVSRGRVINRPSDVVVKRGERRVVARTPRAGDHVLGRAERSVADALVLVPAETAPTAFVPNRGGHPSKGTLPIAGVGAWMFSGVSFAIYLRRRARNVRRATRAV